MTFSEILGTVLIEPLKIVFEMIFSVAWGVVGNPGIAVIILSLCMNTLLMPLYRRADLIQLEAKETDEKMKPVLDHFKKTFSGDERMMMTQTYYRQNHYSPLSALNGSVSLLLEIPFFMAAYQFLSNLEILHGVAFGPIADLGQPDGMIRLGAFSVNLLPILMTVINIVSSALYLKGFPLKAKIQLYGMALLFLVILYDSPSALVLYWTLNNIYSLGKTLFYMIPHAGKVLSVLLGAAGSVCLVFNKTLMGGLHRRLLLVLGLVMLMPLAFMLLKRFMPKPKQHTQRKANTGAYICGALFLTVLVGLLIPSTFISASPLEFVDVFHFYSPMWYIVRTACIAAGMFLVWMSVFYWLSGPNGRVWFCALVWIMSGVLLMNYLFFGTNLGILSSTLQYESGVGFTIRQILLNFGAIAALAAVMFFVYLRWPRSTGAVLLTGVIALSGMSAINIVKTAGPVAEVKARVEELNAAAPSFEFSEDGENVVVLMLDRALGQFMPYIMNENPELYEQFDGFTFYSNTISYGGATNFGAPALFGGYEYTPVELNKRDTERLVDKHNEALKVMPVLFSENGYDVTVFEPPYANYEWIPDLSIYDEYPEIDAYITEGLYGDLSYKDSLIANNKRNFFCFSLMKVMPLFLQEAVYDGGKYNQATDSNGGVQVAMTPSYAEGMNYAFIESYNVLVNLPEITKVAGGTEDKFLMMSNVSTHEPMILQEPEYIPAEYVDNTQYDIDHAGRFTVDGRSMSVDNVWKMGTYHVHVASMMQLGRWFDYLRENGVYDNTKIILVADHGVTMGCQEELLHEGTIGGQNYQPGAERFYPLLMVKDFNSTGFTVSDAFMTNADVPTLAFDGIIENPVNPFTGKAITDEEKTAHDQFIIMSMQWDTDDNNGNTFLPCAWAKVSDDIWVKENWAYYDTETVLKEHAAP